LLMVLALAGDSTITRFLLILFRFQKGFIGFQNGLHFKIKGTMVQIN